MDPQIPGHIKVRIRNKLNTFALIPDLGRYAYCQFYMNRANHLICKNVLGNQWEIRPPYQLEVNGVLKEISCKPSTVN